MDDNLYDEFGNYIGPDIPDMEDNESLEEEMEGNEEQANSYVYNDTPINVII